jgi:hypothetical protein
MHEQQNQQHEFSFLIYLKDLISLQNMSKSQYAKFAAAAHLVEGQCLRDARNCLWFLTLQVGTLGLLLFSKFNLKNTLIKNEHKHEIF